MTVRIFLALNALMIGAIGVLYLYDPNLLLARYDLQTGSVGMDNMLRATYGGLYLVCAVIFSVGVFHPARQRDSLAFVALFMFGAGLGRAVSVGLAGLAPRSVMALLYVEIALFILAVVLLWRGPKV